MHAAEIYSGDFEQTAELGTLVVVAEGDPLRRDAVTSMLLRAGYDVIAFATGAELLQYLYNSISQRPRPDLVVCTAELEGIDGAQICKISRAQDTMLPFIVIARPGFPGAFDSLELADEACVLEADVDLDELRASVERLAGGP